MASGGRVGQATLEIEVRGDASRADAIRATAEGPFLRELVASLDTEVRRRFGEDARLYLRELRVRCEVSERELLAGEAAEPLAADIAAQIAQDLQHAGGEADRPPSPDAAVAVFRSEPARAAAYLTSVARRQAPAWFFRGIGSAEQACASVAQAPASEIAAALEVWRAEEVTPRVAALFGFARATAIAGAAPPGADVSAWSAASARLRAEAPAIESHDISGASTDGQKLGSDMNASSAGSAEISVGGATAPLLDAEGAELAALADAAAREETAVGGVVYLLRLMVELDLGEHLYYAGTLEGAFLARAVIALLGQEVAGDPLPAALAGVTRLTDDPLPALQPWAIEEFTAKATASARAALRRRDRSDKGDLEEVVAAFARDLPNLPQALDPGEPTAAAVNWTAALLGYVFMSALGAPLERRALLARLQIPGAVIDTPEALIVELPLERVDIELRLAGLDFDPGHVPWLGHPARVRYTGGESL